jgi:hypothetical protein
MSRRIATRLVSVGPALVQAHDGLIGAGSGGVVTGGSPLTGALIRGGIGAERGAVTSGNDISLGPPLWR